MDKKEFRQHAHDLVDWMADYLDQVEDYPVRAQVKPGDIAALLPDSAPDAGEDFPAIFEDFKRDVLPGITHWQHPSFFAYFPGNSSPPSLLGEMLTATLASQCMLWQTSPAATEMETKLLDWLRQLTGLPEGLAGVIQDGASSATLCALLTAREKASGWDINEHGMAGQKPMAVYVSADAHSSVEKGAKIAGYGASHVRKIPTDENYAMRLDMLETAIAEDRAQGIVPTCVVATIGGTGTGGSDPIRRVGEICAREDIFYHIDAAWAGSALILPECQSLADGAELADSIVFNPHKWLFTNFDCSAHYVRDVEALIRTFAIMPSYLHSREAGEVIDYRDWGVPLGRRFRALKLWFVMRSYGAEGLRTKLRHHIALAKNLRNWIVAEPDFELTSPLNLTLLTFRHRPESFDGDALNAHNIRLLDALNDSGKLYLTPLKLGNNQVIRFQVGQTDTEQRHVKAAWFIICQTARRLVSER